MNPTAVVIGLIVGLAGAVACSYRERIDPLVVLGAAVIAAITAGVLT